MRDAKKFMVVEFKEIFDAKLMQDSWEIVKSAQSFTILGHKDPDRDTVFSCLAMAEVLARLGKTKVQVIFPNKPFFSVPSISAKVLYGKHNFVAEVVIVCDVSTMSRIYFPPEFGQNSTVINIDHHLNNSVAGTLNFVDVDACSAAEVLARLIFCWDLKVLTPAISQLLLTGLLDDSIVFRTQQSGKSSLFVALKLIERGADFIKAKNTVANYKTTETAKIWATLMSRGSLECDGQMFLIAISQEDFKTMKFGSDALEGLANFVAGIINVDVVALVREVEKETKVSMRSKSKDVQQLAAKFGGGGHKLAAGLTSQEPIQSLVKKLIAAF